MTDAQNQIIGLLKQIRDGGGGGGGGAAWGGITGTLADQLDLKAALDALAPPYKVYTALLTQSGTNDPVATVLQNTLGGAVVWGRGDTGSYAGSLSNAFTENKTACFIGSRFSADFLWMITAQWEDASNIRVRTTARGNEGAGVAEDEILSVTPIEIRVYP